MPAATAVTAYHPPPVLTARLCISMTLTTDGLASVPWRPDAHTGQYLYAQLGPEPSVVDVPIAVFTSPLLCAAAAEDHNGGLAGLPGAARPARAGGLASRSGRPR
jgi:hypothetical protein